MTRTQRTYVVAAAVAAIVTAANASQGAYFSQSWGWVALAFLVPMTVLLIVDRVDVPGRLRVAFAALMVALAVWIGLSAIWSISTPASIREVERALVYVAIALAVALVLRRGDGSAVLAGVGHRACTCLGYALATRLLPDRFDTLRRRRQLVPAGSAARLLELARAPCRDGLLLGARLRGTRDGAPCLARELPRRSRSRHGAVLHLLARRLGARSSSASSSRSRSDPRRVRLLWSPLVVALPASVLCIAYASHARRAHDRGRAAGCGDARRTPTRTRRCRAPRRSRCRSPGWRAGPRGGFRRAATRSSGLRWRAGGRRRGCRRRSRSSSAGGPADAVDELQQRFERATSRPSI